MKIVIISATDFEVTQAKTQIKSNKNSAISFAVTGVGMLATAVNLSKIIYQHQPNLIIQAGIAGCFDVAIPLGQTMLVSQDFLGDIGVAENKKWKDIFDLGLIKPNIKPFTKKGLINPQIQQYSYLQLPTVNSVTVNQITTNQNHIQQLIKKYNPTLESMEGAALHYVCNTYNIPYLQIRSISNYIGERDKTKWNIPLAINNLNKIILQVIGEASSK